MNEQIKAFLEANSYDANTRWGTVNEGDNLRRALAACGNDESKFLRDIDTYSFYASNGRVSFRFKERRTYLNQGKFSFYYHSDHFVSEDIDKNGKPTGTTFVLTEQELYNNRFSISFGNALASGEMFFFADTPKDRILRIMDLAKQEILDRCQEHFGRW